MDTEGVVKMIEEQSRRSHKAEMFDWLMSQMRGSGLHMNGTDSWSLPHSVICKYRTKTPQEAVAAAYAQYLSWVADNQPNAQESVTGAQE